MRTLGWQETENNMIETESQGVYCFLFLICYLAQTEEHFYWDLIDDLGRLIDITTSLQAAIEYLEQ